MASITVVTSAGAAAATAAGASGAQITVVGFQIGSNVISIDTTSGAAYTSVAGLVYPTQSGVDPNTLITGTANKITYQVINNDTMLFKITLDPTIGDFNVGNVGLLINTPGGTGYTLFSITSFSSADLKYKNNAPVNGNTRIINIAIKLTSLLSVVNVSYINVDNYVLPTVPNYVSLPSAASALSPVYVVRNDSLYGTTALAVRNANGSTWNHIPIDTGWSNAGDISVYAQDIGTPNNVAATVVPAFSAYTAGRTFRVKLANGNSNTGTVTLNINGIGAVAVINPENTALVAGQLVANGVYQFVYDGSQFQLTSISVPAVNKRGDTISGALRVNGSFTTDTSMAVNGASGTQRIMYMGTNNVPRWSIFTSAEVETSTDLVGSNFGIGWFNNAGNYIDTAIYISRLTGITAFRYIPTSPTPPDNDSSLSLANTSFIQKLIQSGANLYTQDTGAVNALVAVLIPAPATYYGGLIARIRVANSNTGAVTLNLNGLGIKNVVNPDGSALSAAQFSTGAIIQVIYDSTRFQLMSAEYAAVNRAGDIMTGPLTVSTGLTVTSVAPSIYLNGTANNNHVIYWQTTSKNRWSLYSTSDAESGGDTGTLIKLSRYHDDGSFAGDIFSASRQTGVMNFTVSPISVTPAINDNSFNLATTQYVDRQTGPAIFYGNTYGVDSSGSANTINVNLNPVIVSPAAGYMLRIKVANTNTGTTTLNLSTTGATLSAELRNPDGTSLLSNQLIAGSIIDVVYDGTRFQILSKMHPAVNRTGDTMTGALSVKSTLIVNDTAGTIRQLMYQSANSARWLLFTDNSTETGSNIGSNFYIARYDDTGAYNGNVLSITRNNGIVSFTSSPLVPTAQAGDTTQKAASTAFVAFAGTPVGAVIDYAGPNAPAGWLLCVGQLASRTGFAALFAAIGTTWGAGDGYTTFRIPDLRGRTTFGADNMGGVAANVLTSGSISVSAVFGIAAGSQYQQIHSHSITDQVHAHAITQTNHNHSLTQTPHSHISVFGENDPPYGGVNYGSGGASSLDYDQVQPYTSPEYASISCDGAQANISINAGYSNIGGTNNYGAGSSQNIPPMLVMNKIIYAGV